MVHLFHIRRSMHSCSFSLPHFFETHRCCVCTLWMHRCDDPFFNAHYPICVRDNYRAWTIQNPFHHKWYCIEMHCVYFSPYRVLVATNKFLKCFDESLSQKMKREQHECFKYSRWLLLNVQTQQYIRFCYNFDVVVIDLLCCFYHSGWLAAFLLQQFHSEKGIHSTVEWKAGKDHPLFEFCARNVNLLSWMHSPFSVRICSVE